MKKGARVEPGEGRDGENLELEGLGVVLKIWQNSKRVGWGLSARFCECDYTSFEFSWTLIHCLAVGTGFSILLAMLGT